jgi:predicted MPP superfamily phosphohydrolase
MRFQRFLSPTVKLRNVVRGCIAVFLLFLVGAVWGFLIEPNRLIVREETIRIQSWPRELSGLRVALISDI